MKARATGLPRRLAGLLVMAVLLATPARGESQVGVDVIQQLSFGVLLPGVSYRVGPADTGHGEVLITVKGRVSVVLQLPAELQAPSGATVPLTYAATDAEYQLGTGVFRAFDPRTPLTVNVSASAGTLRIRFGGTVAPGAQQEPGQYDGAVAVQVTPL